MYRKKAVYLKGGGQHGHLVKIKADGNNKATVSDGGSELADLEPGL